MQYNYLFSFDALLDLWTPLRASYHSLFSDQEINRIGASFSAFNSAFRTTVLCAFENRHARAGGLGDTLQLFSQGLRSRGESVLYLTPLHRYNPSIQKALRKGRIRKIISDIYCSLGPWNGTFDCYEEFDTVVPTYYLNADDFFTCIDHPYAYQDQNHLMNDICAFSIMVPFALRALGKQDHVLLHLHDWETALLALSSKMAICHGIVNSVKTLLTLHNIYDATVPDPVFEWFLGRSCKSKSILETSIPFTDGPVCTTSDTFAHDLRQEPLLYCVLTKHITHAFSKNPPIGISFGEPMHLQPFSSELRDAAAHGDFLPLIREKHRCRKSLLRAIAALNTKKVYGRVVETKKKVQPPLFFIRGEAGNVCNGMDVVVHAFNRIAPDRAKLLVHIAADSGSGTDMLAWYKHNALESDGGMLLVVGTIPKVLSALMMYGTAFFILPSFYEPSGSCAEPFSSATPVLARATGGLIDQTISYRRWMPPAFYKQLYIATPQERQYPNGMLYREESNDPQKITCEWDYILSHPPQERLRSSLYISMVDETHKVLEEACICYSNPNLYGNLALNALNSASGQSWDLCAARYQELYECIQRHAF